MKMDIIESAVTSGLTPEETLRHLESAGIEWYVSDQGDLMIRYWQVAAEGFVSPEHVGRIQMGQAAPKEADSLEWVSRHLDELRRRHAGQWIAVVQDRIMASAPNLAGLLDQLRTAGVEHPFVTQIPAGPITWITAYAG